MSRTESSDHVETASAPTAAIRVDPDAAHDELQSERRDVAAIEQEMVDAVEWEAQQLVATARAQIREILLKTRQDLLVLRAQLGAAHDHVRGVDPHARHLVRDIIGSLRRDIQAVDREGDAMQAALLEYREDIAKQPLPAVPRLAPAAESTDADAVQPTAMPATRPRRRPLRLAVTTALVVVGALGIAAARWWTRSPLDVRSTLPKVARAALPSPVALPPIAVPDDIVAPTGIRVSLAVREPVWVRIGVNGSTDGGQILPAGTRRDISGDRVSIRAGNAGALTVSVNGAPVEFFGPKGAPLTRTFGPPAPQQPPVASTQPSRALPDATVTTQPVRVTPTTPPAAASLAPITRPPSAAPPAPAPLPRQPITTGAAIVPSASAALATSVPGPAPEADIMRGAETWLFAFFNRDQATMTRSGGATTVIDDQRPAAARPPAGLELRRSLEQVKVQIVGVSALYTARLVETPQGGGAQYVSLVSQVWLRSGDAWQVMSVRLMPEARVREMLR